MLTDAQLGELVRRASAIVHPNCLIDTRQGAMQAVLAKLIEDAEALERYHARARQDARARHHARTRQFGGDA